jgi:hypothetical protein
MTGTAEMSPPHGYPAAAGCTVFALPNVDPAILAPLTVPGVRVCPFDVEAVLAALDSDTGICAILWPDPAALIAQALADGQVPFAVAGTWRLAAQQVLDIHRRNRRRLVLIDARLFVAGEAGAAGRAQLASRMGLAADFAPADGADLPDEVAMALAAAVLPRLPDVEACLDALLSVSLSPVTDTMPSVDLTTLGAEYVRLTAAAQEVDLLRQQVALQQQEAAQSKAAALDNLHNETRKRQAAEQQRDRLARRVSDLTSKLEKVFASTSWRATKPLRKVKGLISRGPPSVDLVLIEEKRLTEDALSAGDGKSQTS